MSDIEIGTETESPTHWQYQVRVFADGRTHQYQVMLSFQDYDLWSRGRVPPSRVVHAAMRFLLARESAEQIMPRFDCAVIRRYFPEVDRELGELL